MLHKAAQCAPPAAAMLVRNTKYVFSGGSCPGPAPWDPPSRAIRYPRSSADMRPLKGWPARRWGSHYLAHCSLILSSLGRSYQRPEDLRPRQIKVLKRSGVNLECKPTCANSDIGKRWQFFLRAATIHNYIVNVEGKRDGIWSFFKAGLSVTNRENTFFGPVRNESQHSAVRNGERQPVTLQHISPQAMDLPPRPYEKLV